MCPARARRRAGVAKVHKLSSNENPLGASPKAIEAVRAVAGRLEFYPDGSATRLREAIAEAHGLNPANIVCSNGSDEILGLLAQTYLAPGDEAIFTEHGFLVYKIYIQAAGATPVVVKETRRARRCRRDPRRGDADARRSSSSPIPTIRPAPTCRSRRCAACMPACPATCCWCSTRPMPNMSAATTTRPASSWSPASQNVVMTRTFSKIHGLGGARIGWMYAPAHIVDALNRMRGPFNVNAAAIEAGIAAMRDRAHVERTVAHNETLAALADRGTDASSGCA